MAMTVKGTVYAVMDAKQVSDKFRKREFVLETADNPKYPQKLLLEATNDKCELLDQVGVGDTLTVEIDLRGREWRSPSGETKYFNTISAWKIEVTAKAAARPEPVVGGGDQDDIPFASCSLSDEPSPIARVLR
jgi:uncharacterized protein DUF3127